jgi:mono/diheme cytochrome c family protein
MRNILLALLAAPVFGLLGGAAFIWLGIYDVSATRPHWSLSYWLMETTRARSVKAHAAGITPPPELTGEAKILAGTEHFAAHCAVCHGAPGVPPGDIASGLYPRPADLRISAKRYTPGELFWIVKNGIKMSGMPSWADHGDDELWGTVGFIEKLPTMSEDDYRELVLASMAHGGGHHSHGSVDGANPERLPMDHSSMPGMSPLPDNGPRH